MRTHRKALQDRFVDAVRAGDKITTIRPLSMRNAIPEAGELIRFYRWTGRPYRSKQAVVGCFRITKCMPVVVSRACISTPVQRPGWKETMMATVGRFEDVYRDEGFQSWNDLIEWFRKHHGLPFTGMMIGWDPARLDNPDPFPIP
ncbi:MAG: ASCH domain-containing protein [Verrucomicrobia bacterium]|nr:ASCH domain-containing protein [Verrucomicrobiota bacterium]